VDFLAMTTFIIFMIGFILGNLFMYQARFGNLRRALFTKSVLNERDQGVVVGLLPPPWR
jgi:hypothetical protein